MSEEQAREIAVKILDRTFLYGNKYYALEDWITNLIMGKDVQYPLEYGYIGTISDIVKLDVEDYFEATLDDYDDQDVEEVSNRIMNELDTDFDQEISYHCYRYLNNKNN